MFWCSLVELDAILTLIFLIVYGLGSLRNITGSSFDINFFSRLFPVLFLIGFLLEAGGCHTSSPQGPLPGAPTCEANPLANTTGSCLARGPWVGPLGSSLLEQDLSSVLGPQSMGSMIEWALVALTIVILYNFRSLESLLLLLFAFLGQYFMLHSVDFLSFFIALEVQNFCFFVLCGLCSSKSELKSKSFSVEGALKYFLLSAFSSGVMLFWFSAIYLQTGQSSFLAITPFHDESFSFFYTFMIVGALMFKLGAAPLHLWVTQIYGNVTRSLLLFVSTAPKLAFFGFWLNAFHGFYYGSSNLSTTTGLTLGVWHTTSSCEPNPLARQLEVVWQGAPNKVWGGVSIAYGPCLGLEPCAKGPSSVLFFAAFSLILGAFAAYSQPALRSLFAYSTINEVGLLLSAVETAGWNTLFQHLGIYLISQVLLWNCFHRKFLALLAVSFAGLPPLAGFFGKAWIFWHISSVGFYSILALALFCTCVSLVYYLRLIRLFYENPTPSLYVKYSGTVIGKDTLSLLSDGLTREKVVATCLILLFSIPFFVLKPSFVL